MGRIIHRMDTRHHDLCNRSYYSAFELYYSLVTTVQMYKWTLMSIMLLIWSWTLGWRREGG